MQNLENLMDAALECLLISQKSDSIHKIETALFDAAP